MKEEAFSMFAKPEIAKKLIAIIDDSLTIRKIIEVCLKREGFIVQGFPDGVEAIRSFAQPDVRIPDLILLDLCLPKMDGYAVARHLKAKPAFSQCPIVVLSRRDGLLDRLRGRLAGANTHIGKPFKTQEVIMAVASLIGPSQAVVT